MVFDFKRLLTGLYIVFTIFFTYYFNLDLPLIILLIFLSLYETYISKILLKKNLIFFFITILISFLILKLNNLIILYLIFFIFLFLSIFNKNSNIFFTSTLIILFCFLFYLNILDRNIFYLLFIFSFINDTSAFIAGRIIKGPKILAKISPNKTWSGTIISTFITYLILIYFKFDLIYSIFLSISFFVGDIYFSKIKRLNNIKDFSNLLGSHGGILDRLDSILIPSALILFYFNFVQ